MDDLFERYGPSYRWLATGTCILGATTVVLAQTTVNVAFPDIMGAFSIGRDQAQWLSLGFFASMTAGMLLQAWLVAIFGERRTYAAALIAFTIGAAMSGLATNVEFLTVGRLIQGISAGIIQPLAMALTFKVFPAERRGTAMGLFAMGIVFAPAMGPTLGGIAIEWFNWRYVFLLTVPSSLLAVLLGMVFLPSRRIPSRLPLFDLIGFMLMCAALFSLLLALSNGTRDGWDSDNILLLFGFGTVAAVSFILWELRTPNPLLNMHLFSYPQFSAAALIAFFTGGVFLTSTFLIPVFVQQVQSYTPLRAGLLLMPGGLSLLLLFPLAGRISDSVPAGFLLSFGLCSFGIGFILLSGVSVDTPFWTFVAFTLFVRTGLGFTSPVTNAVALKSLPFELVSQGSGTISFIRQLGAAFILNAVVAYLEYRVRFHGDALTATQTAASRTSQSFLDGVRRILSESGVPDSVQYSGALHYLGQIIQAQAQTFGFQDAFIILAALSLLSLIAVYVLVRTRS